MLFYVVFMLHHNVMVVAFSKFVALLSKFVANANSNHLCSLTLLAIEIIVKIVLLQ